MTIENSQVEEPIIGDDANVPKAFKRAQSKKTEAIEILFGKVCPAGLEEGQRAIASSDQVVAAIEKRNGQHVGEKEPLSTRNPANFLKDLIRVSSCNQNWPATLKDRRITARQVYGKKQVLEFVSFGKDDALPFPDRFDPVKGMPVTPFETLSIPVEARQLGRRDEPWLIQVSVGQRVLHAHFAIHAAEAGLRIETLAHLQTSVKTQPEIDATFIASVRAADGKRYRAYITVEAKQIRERILEYQIREQVAQAFKFTAGLKGNDAIDAILPVAIKVVDHGGERGIYIAQFEPIDRTTYSNKYRADENLHEMPLTVQSRSFFVPRPAVGGISK